MEIYKLAENFNSYDLFKKGNMQMKKGEYVTTPRFLMVKIQEVFNSEREAAQAGYTEPTYYYYNHDDYNVVGRFTGVNQMEFAAYKL